MEPAEDGRGTIADQAIDWLVRLDAGHADPRDFEAWRAADPRHAAAFAQVAWVWQRTGELRSAGLGSEQARVQHQPEPDATEPHRDGALYRRRRVLGGLAAGAVGLLGLGTYALTTQRASAATAVGERRVLRLPQGSSAALNTDTRIAWREGRSVELWLEQGEAALTVAAQGMTVRAASLIGQLAPGRYNVRQLGQDAVELITFSGLAQVALGAGAPRPLAAGQRLALDAGGLHQTTLAPAAIEAATAWQRGEIVFDGMTLRAALGEFNRYLRQPIEIGDPRLDGLRLGGRFAVDDPSGFLAALHDAFGIASHAEGERIVLTQAAR